MEKLDIQKEFSTIFPWHYDPLSHQPNDCPDLGTINFDYQSLVDHVLTLCSTQDPKTSGKGFSYYYDDKGIKKDIVSSRDAKFQKLFDTWIKSNWNTNNSCFYEFHDQELGDFYKPLLESYLNKLGNMDHCQIRIFVKPPMTALGLHADTFGTYTRKHKITEDQVFRAFTLVEDWQWGHYALIGNTVLHQYRAGQSYQIKPNVFHCVGNIGFNPQITMNITGVKI